MLFKFPLPAAATENAIPRESTNASLVVIIPV
jgi:hypothetical protein